MICRQTVKSEVSPGTQTAEGQCCISMLWGKPQLPGPAEHENHPGFFKNTDF